MKFVCGAQPHAASTLRNVTAIKMAPGLQDSSLAGGLLGPAQLFEDFCAYLSDVAGFEVDKVSPAAITLTWQTISCYSPCEMLYHYFASM